MPVPAAARQPDPPGVGWFATPPAQRLLREEQREVLPLLAGCYGQHALYLRGFDGAPAQLAGSMLQKTVVLHGARDALRGELQCRAGEWPLLRESVDLVYLLHAFEARTPPAALLAEAERVLTPEGTLLSIGLNPFSPWRARWAAAGVRALSATTTREHLRDAGFDIVQERGLGPVLPWLDHGRRETSGRDAWSALRAGYVLMARKRRIGLTPLRAARPAAVAVPTA